MMSKSLMRKALDIAIIMACIFSILPIALIIMDSFKSGSELAANSWGIPMKPTFDNYYRLLSYNTGTITKSFLNGMYVSTLYTILTIAASALAAYAFSKYRFRGRNMIFFLLISTMMIPQELTLPPLYIMFSRLHWLNTFTVQIVPTIANIFCMFMLKQYIDTLPNSLIESARIDGAGHFKVFHKIIFPLASPAVGALAILIFLGKWNEYLWPSIFLSKPKVMPIMVILPTLTDGTSAFSIPWEMIVAGCTVVTVPLIIVFFIFQEKFMSSVTIGAVKE